MTTTLPRLVMKFLQQEQSCSVLVMYTGLVPSGNAARYWEDRSEADDMKSLRPLKDWSLSWTALEKVEKVIVEVPFGLVGLG